MKKRCDWCLSSPVYVKYHDEEWGVPVHDDKKLFEFLILESMQAGLSWLTILKRRENYRKAFLDFQPDKITKLRESDVRRLMKNVGIIRHEGKIRAAVTNARAFIKIQEQFGTFDAYCWRFVNGNPIINNWQKLSDIPATTSESDTFSKDLKRRGFKFAGSTITYAFMQAVGMVNDHLAICFRHKKKDEE